MSEEYGVGTAYYFQQKHAFEKTELENKIKMLETLIELNMKDCHEIADQRNKYYEELQTWKDMYNNLLDLKEALEKRISNLESSK